MFAGRRFCSCPSLFQMLRSLRNLLLWCKYLQVDENAKMNERRVKYFAYVSNRSVLFRVIRHLSPVMDAELLVQRIANKISLEPTRQIFEKQVLAKVLTPGEFEVGLGSHSLSRYSYAPGEMILCRRNTEEWVRWHSPITTCTRPQSSSSIPICPT